MNDDRQPVPGGPSVVTTEPTSHWHNPKREVVAGEAATIAAALRAEADALDAGEESSWLTTLRRAAELLTHGYPESDGEAVA